MRSWVFIALLVALSASASASPDAFASLTVNPVIEADDTPNPAQDLVEQMKQAQAESSKSLEEVDKVGDSALAQFRQTELQSTKQLEAEHKARKEQKRFAKKLAKLKHTERHKLLELQAQEEERLKAERRKMTELEAAQEARAHRIQRLIKLIQKERKRLVKQRQRHVKQVARLSKKLRKHDKKTLHRFQTLMSARERRLEAAIASVNQRNVQLQQQLANLKANADNAVVNKVTADTQRVASVLANVRAEEEKQKQSIDQRVRAVEEAEAQTDSSVVERLSHLTEEQDEAPKAQPKAQEEEEQQEGEEKAEDDATETADQ